MKISNKKILHIESFLDTPLLETSLEIAYRLKKNNDVFFFIANKKLPWADIDIPFYKKILGMSFSSKIEILKKLLTKKNIKFIENIDIEKRQKKIIDNWSNRYCIKKNLRKFLYKKINLGLGCESSFLSIYKNHDFHKKNLANIRKSLITSATIYERSLLIIERIKPDFVITFNNRFATTKPIIEAAKKMGIKVIRHEVGSSSKKFEIFMEDVHNLNQRCKSIYNYWKKTSKSIREKNALAYFNSPKKKLMYINTNEGRVKRFGNDQDKKFIPFNNRKNVVFFTSSNYEFLALTNDYLDFSKSKDFKDQLSAVKNTVNVIKRLKDYNLIIRVHPSRKSKLQNENNYWLRFHDNKKIIVIGEEDKTNSFDLLKKSDVVITYGSSLAVHAVYNGKPSISLRKHSFSCSGIFIEPNSKKDLFSILKNANFPKVNRKKCYPFGNYLITFGMKFKYYRSHSLLKGFFNKTVINHYGLFINILLSAILKIKIFLSSVNKI